MALRPLLWLSVWPGFDSTGSDRLTIRTADGLNWLIGLRPARTNLRGEWTGLEGPAAAAKEELCHAHVGSLHQVSGAPC